MKYIALGQSYMGMKPYEHATETPVRFCTAIEPRPPLPYLAGPCVWLGYSNRRSSVLRGSKQSALAARRLFDHRLQNVYKTTGKNCYSLTPVCVLLCFY